MAQDDRKASFERATEQRYYGKRVCEKIFATRPQDIISVNLDKRWLGEFSNLLRWCAEHRKAYHLVEKEQLDTITKSTHHEGIVMLAKKRFVKEEADFMQDLKAGRLSGCIVILDGVENPHNLGAVLRSCANFGVKALVTNDGDLKSLPSSTCRVSEGGSELVDVYRCQFLANIVASAKGAGFVTVSTSSKAKPTLFAHNFHANTCLILGSEHAGVSDEVLKQCDVTLSIPGTEAIQSLNIASAAAILLGEYWRQKIHTQK